MAQGSSLPWLCWSEAKGTWAPTASDALESCLYFIVLLQTEVGFVTYIVSIDGHLIFLLSSDIITTPSFILTWYYIIKNWFLNVKWSCILG